MKYIIELLVILFLSVGLAILFPNFLRESKTIEIRNVTELAITSVAVFVLLSLVYFSYKKQKN